MIDDKNFSKYILRWFDQHGRTTLPWQINKNPYRVWVSEIMLQQTQVTTVIPYYERFMQRFPCIENLAKAQHDEVLHLWTGLGYYSRARNLHCAAKMVSQEYAGQFPSEVNQLVALPGIGLSTAGAIVAIAFEKRATILDGNVKRVLSRFYGILQWPGEKKISERLWKLAEVLTPKKRVADYTQAMMDLGATVCVRNNPRCEACPLARACTTYAQGLQKHIPAKKPAKKMPVRETHFLILRRGHAVLLEKRPPSGIWGGLWSFPQIPFEDDFKNLLKKMGLRAGDIFYGKTFRHTFTHFHLDIAPIYIEVTETQNKISENSAWIWYDLQLPQALGLPGPVKKIVSQLMF